MNQVEKDKTLSRVTVFAGLLTVLFIMLKSVGAIDWSWWWVFMPAVASAGTIAIVLIISAVLTLSRMG